MPFYPGNRCLLGTSESNLALQRSKLEQKLLQAVTENVEKARVARKKSVWNGSRRIN